VLVHIVLDKTQGIKKLQKEINRITSPVTAENDIQLNMHTIKHVFSETCLICLDDRTVHNTRSLRVHDLTLEGGQEFGFKT